MNYRKHGLRALGLSFAAVLGLMALMAAGAQAEAKFLYLAPALTTLTQDSEPIISAHTDLTLLVPTKNLTILCQKVESDTTAPVVLLGTNRAPNGGIAHGHLKFKECRTFTHKAPFTEQTKCVPKSPGTAAGEILAGGLLKLILHPANNTMVLFEPLKEKPFTTLEFPETCALFESGNVTGSVAFECGELKPAGTFVGGNCATHRVKQLLKSVSEALAKALGDTFKFGLNEGTLGGIVAVEFGAPCAGCAWGADAE